ncbi:MAG: pyruvate kinase [Candidatus Lambdaproteobacteria bacterium RIFOXYD1_FULL_56_27]|uniref:Pyruvate kinase n=1 Tax=Candidatus Lambdaproteobacteria bacterium RIFOXYD2_FULL_56_26 TaxID=1817773 RepID=A0A1F6GL78_9PROT|nr:MAG: pyruvate kinase [Candidatus Lambdaproteobacteria bacterium RIFOXYD2_FULL_56_26]OGH03573.1 MAG: pyruvate kinase [Candidatus Lambdaproteobacteria bacterium RIFOXYC1_FULL_56_13]OGH08710.1 MAG: pyruvate kinase [Candidatus Lambdaproteobacteria bacterium RIFOXYD1_FULL_56_27]
MKPTRLVKSKILCTLGPSSRTEAEIGALYEQGMDMVRINFSHGSPEEKRELFATVKAVDPNLAILCDIQGPKIRIGEVKAGGALLRRGTQFTLTTEEVMGDETKATISYKPFPAEVKTGERVFINDGIVCLEVLQIKGKEVVCKVLSGGTIFTRKGVNLPTTKLSLRVPTEKDIVDLKLIAELDPAYLAASFVGTADDVETIRHILASYGNDRIKLISKIERPIAVDNFEEILAASDGIMVARGDLGVELPAEQVPPIQKEMIRRCNIAGKPIIVATQMLESMTKAPIATRAEVSDVYNAIADGADCVMLSAETASGEFPTEAVFTMERIIMVSEDHLAQRNPDWYDSKEDTVSEVIGHLTHQTCKQLIERGNGAAGKIICLTRSGHTARMVSKYRPPFPILALTPDARAAQEMKLLWGVAPFHMPELAESAQTLSRIHTAIQACYDRGFLTPTEKVIVVGDFFNLPSQTNMVSILTVGDVLGLEE